MNLKLLLGGLLVTIGTAIVGYKEKQKWTEILILVFCQATFTLCIEIYLAKTKSEKILGPLADQLQADTTLLTHMKTIIKHSLEVRGLKSKFMGNALDRYMQDVEATVEGMAAGMLQLDLGPGGRFYSEGEVVDVCQQKYLATSMVDPVRYWHSRQGQESLAKNRECAVHGKRPTRIFIEQRSRLPELRPFLEEHMAAGVICYVAIEEEIDKSLRRDFALLDDNAVAAELVLDRDRMPTHSKFLIYERNSSRREIEELVRVWKDLERHARPAQEFLQNAPAQGTR